MKKNISVIGSVVGIAILLFSCSDTSAPVRETATGTQYAITHEGADNQVMSPEVANDTVKADVSDTPEQLIARIENKQAAPEERVKDFDLLKARYPDVALKFARRKADEFSLANQELLGRTHLGRRRGLRDLQAEGDFDIGSWCVNLVMQTDIEKYATPRDKVRYVIKTAGRKNWVSGTGGFINQYCGDIDESIGFDFSSAEDSRFLSDCGENCDLDCLETIWKRHVDDWTTAGVSLKTKILVRKCSNNGVCGVDALLQRLREPDDAEHNVHGAITGFIALWPWGHCVPFETMMAKAGEIKHEGLIKALKSQEKSYREKIARSCGGK